MKFSVKCGPFSTSPAYRMPYSGLGPRALTHLFVHQVVGLYLVSDEGKCGIYQ